jgi:type III restriction enzyme
MELKDYQQTVLDDLDNYLASLLACEGNMPKAFTDYWQDRGVLNQKYKTNVQGVPHVCVKVPTAGGKTFIAVNALSNIFEAFEQHNPVRPKFVVWLVPSLTILEQTVKHLSNPDHPYRQRLNVLFNGRVQVYQKAEVIQGAGFNADTVRDQLSVVVMSFDSLKATNKENRKAYQDNGYLASFLQAGIDNANYLLPEYDASSLINVIRSLKPVVVVDESHNAESALSVDMLNNLNPSFIFDLTATPRNNSNIISYIDAMQLKKQHMVKLPVIVANQQTQEDVIMAALKMRLQLEEYAKQEEAHGGEYIRPIVLFQAEPKSKDDTTTFVMVKKMLVDLDIPEDQIKIKTANINELKGIDLMSRDCEVRYIITINALKEGWDCPFAYVLATLANKSSVVDVTQILGRVLRMPHVQRHKVDYLNLSYVFTSSSRFKETLSHVVAGLNRAGFSHQDYRVLDVIKIDDAPPNTPSQPDLDLTGSNEGLEVTIDPNRLNKNWANEALNASNQGTNGISNDTHTSSLEIIKAKALAENQAYEQAAEQHLANECPPELEGDMNLQKMKPNLVDSATDILLPQFFQKVETGGFFDDDEAWQKLSRNNLLSGFLLANLNSNILFNDVDTEVYQVDLIDIGGGESAPEFSSVDKKQKQRLNAIIHTQSFLL